MQYQKMQGGQGGQLAQFGNGQGQRNFPRGSGGPGTFRNGGPFDSAQGKAVFGQIISTDDKSIIVKLMDGSSKIVLLSDGTTISKASAGSKTDLSIGSNVAVLGTTNSDGSVSAQNVQLNPMMGRGGRPMPSSSPVVR